jgi:hypothetical protein
LRSDRRFSLIRILTVAGLSITANGAAAVYLDALHDHSRKCEVLATDRDISGHDVDGPFASFGLPNLHDLDVIFCVKL